MSELREKIGDLVMDIFAEGVWQAEGVRSLNVKGRYTDRIMALIAEALLSDSAVIAAQNAGQPDSVLGVHHHCGTDAVQAALTAAGITGAGQEGGSSW